MPRSPATRSKADALRAAGRLVAILGLAVLLGSTAAACSPQPRYPGRPVVQNPADAARPAAARTPRPTPLPEQRQAMPQGDVVDAAKEYVTALYTGDDVTAAQYLQGYTELLRKDEDDLVLEEVSARPMSWGEAGYADADPTLEWAEVVARVHGRRGDSRGSVYYKLGFRREGDQVQIDLASRRMDVR